MSLEQKKKQLASLENDVKRHTDELYHYSELIFEAENKGMDGFDRDRFMVKREKE
jgi:hypothetical protein